MTNTITIENTYTQDVNKLIKKGNNIYEAIQANEIEETTGAIRILQLVGAIKQVATYTAQHEGIDEIKFKKWQSATESLQHEATKILTK